MAGELARYAGMCVLVIDDSHVNVMLIRALLEENGITRVYSVTDSRQVPRLLVECEPDLVILDLHMPHVDGHQVLGQVQQFAAGSYLPVLVLTADTTTESRDRALRQGAQDFLTKPLDLVEATLRIANLLEARQLYVALRRAGTPPTGEQLSAHETSVVYSRIQDVIRQGALTPVFQPIADVNTLSVLGYEALSRFADPAREQPRPWFSDAFAVGLGVELEWCAATAALRLLDAMPVGAFLAVNMSPASILRLADDQICDPDDCSKIVIELTEHVPVEDYSAVHRALVEMRSNGTRLAADDLGSGYAGFRHLINLRPDIIKLDISLIAGIHRSDTQRALASALVAFARDIGSTVIGEGVEQVEELEVLRAIGVHWAQGYHIGRPGPAPSVLEGALAG